MVVYPCQIDFYKKAYTHLAEVLMMLQVVINTIGKIRPGGHDLVKGIGSGRDSGLLNPNLSLTIYIYIVNTKIRF